MLSSLNSLLVAWALTLIIIVGGVTYLEMTHHSDEDPHETETNNKAGNEGNSLNAKTEDTTDNATHEDDIHQNTDPIPAETKAADPVKIDPPKAARNSLSQEVIDTLLEKTDTGNLPRVSSAGLTPFKAYAGPHPTGDTRPKIAIVITDIGLSGRRSNAAIQDTPSAITLALSPYGSVAKRWVDDARTMGHETLLMIPMEPQDYPRNDPGPLTLLTGKASARHNMQKLHEALGSMTRYIGVINHMGSRFTASSEELRPIMQELRKRGLMFVDARTSSFSRAAAIARGSSVPVAINNGYIDETLNASSIARQLTNLENRARTLGVAVGVARPYPVSVNAINAWATTLESKGFILVPISAVADRQPIR